MSTVGALVREVTRCQVAFCRGSESKENCHHVLAGSYMSGPPRVRRSFIAGRNGKNSGLMVQSLAKVIVGFRYTPFEVRSPSRLPDAARTPTTLMSLRHAFGSVHL